MARVIEALPLNVVGTKVKQFRTAKKMSQQALSAQLELLGIYVCRGSVSRIEDHQRTVTDMELYAFSKVLNVPVMNLYEDSFVKSFE